MERVQEGEGREGEGGRAGSEEVEREEVYRMCAFVCVALSFFLLCFRLCVSLFLWLSLSIFVSHNGGGGCDKKTQTLLMQAYLELLLLRLATVWGFHL
jgi:hypothetical protein